jgi:exodeoxyribonuclease V gamma subunit
VEAPGLQVVTGDSPHALLAELDRTLATWPLSPFDDDIVVVQSLGMERWVRQQLARRRGCAASLQLPFPAAFCRKLAESLADTGRVGGETGAPTLDKRFEEEALTWRLFALLSDDDMLADAVYAPLRAFLEQSDPAKRYGLARRVSARFDEYRLYRPDMLLAWETGEPASADHAFGEATGNPHAAWQRALWQQVLQRERPMHFARWFLHTIERLEQASVRPAGLPDRLSVFGISTLPPLFVRLLRAVARFAAVRFFVLVPADPRHDGRSSHPLTTQFGHASHELLTLLGASEAGASRHVQASMPTDDSLLHHLQRALRASEQTPAACLVTPADRSVSVHVCHSPLREMEVLRDQLLDAFAADPALRPHDVLVMVPDVELYAPLAEAVFGGAMSESRPRIPFRVADRALTRESAPLQALELLLRLVSSRLGVSDVLRLLSVPSVHRRVGVTPAQVEQLTGWVQQAGIRWGWDADDRVSRFGVPSFAENSWRLGLDRLMAGYAMGPVDVLIEEHVPVAGDLVGDAELLGVFVRWVDDLERHLMRLREARPLSAWSTVLADVFAWVVKPDGSAEEATMMQIADAMRELQEPSGAPRQRRLREAHDVEDPVVAFEVVRDWIMAALDSDEHATGFLTGGLTICAMKPMRAIPHRVIAMLGLDDRSYPRRERRPAFDLIGSDRRIGDRDPRTDDRQLVLDTLLCAEDRLHLSYVGRSQTNNAEIAPSIVVAELLQYLQRVVRTGDNAPHPLLRVEHRLQPFSTAYFEATAPDTALFSFDGVLAASVRDVTERGNEPPFSGRAAAPSRTDEVITLDDLMLAWSNPSQLHAERTLHLSLRDHRDVLDDVEPTVVDALLRTRLQQQLLDEVLHGAGERRAAARLSALGELPPGPLGTAWQQRLVQHVDPLLERIGTPRFLEPLTVDLRGQGWHLVGRLDYQHTGEQWRVRAATLKPRDVVRGWIAHLARQAMGVGGTTRVMALDQEVQFAPQADAMARLEWLVHAYQRMLAEPQPYFLTAAVAYRKAIATALSGRGAAKPPLEAARAKFAPGGDYGDGDLDDPYVALLWRGRDPFAQHADAFVSLVDAFWEPLEAAQTVVAAPGATGVPTR